MISVVKSTTRRQAHVKARSSSATSAAAATAAPATAAVVKNSSASNSNNNNNNNNNNNTNNNHFQNTGDDAAFGSLNHLADSYEKFENDRKPAALNKQQPTPAAAAIVVSTVDRKITTSDSDNNKQPEKASDNQTPQTAVAAVAAAAAAAAAASVAAAEAAAVVAEPSSEGGQQRPRPENIPKFVRVGQKVCFSTVVAAVLIPSSEDISEASKRELWWQATDYAEFRLNYAMRMQDPSMEKDYDYAPDKYTANNDENCYGYDNADCYSSAGGGGGRLQGNENTVPYAVASVNEPSGPATVGYHYGNQGGMLCASSPHVMAGRAQHAPTATVEGVLVVAAAPAPAVLASRPYPSNELCHAGMGMGPQGGKQNGSMLKGNNGGGPVVSSTGQQGRATKSSRYERAARPRSNMNPDEQQQKLGSRRRVVVGGGGGVAPPGLAHRRHQAHAGQRVTRGGRPAPACYGGRRDGRNEPDYAMPRGSGFQHGGGVGVGGGGGQFFVNGYPAGVYDAPPSRAAYGNNAHYGHGAAMAEAYLPVHQHQQQRHHHAHGGGMIGGVGGGGSGAAYAPSSGALGAPSVVMMPAPSSSQFSMWRSQLVFSPVMMQ